MATQTLTCADCSTNFEFSESEQAFYAEKGFSAPRRCRPCRDAAKAQRNQGGGRSAGGFGGGPSRPREMHEAVCATCGTLTQVPFKPTGARPVYCRNCFQR
ncbi:MAG: CxxC-x17-CxxC domain-containing protein [Candidatus Sericytochromatia bacterium]|nr:CxxC-x17-CxxC domain-containing protein [Candidatus Sericytochromatia bacterium]